MLHKKRDYYWLSLLLTVVFVTGCIADSQSGDQDMEQLAAKKYIVDGHLAACPQSPNCVNSEDLSKESFIAPLEFTGSAAGAWQILQEQILDMGGRIEEVDDSFLHATFRSSLFRFVDDVSCRLDDENNRIYIRSASRVGYSDFGVNRKRVEQLRKQFTVSL